MAKEMLINVSAGEECRIALVDNGKLEELYMERTSSTSHVGNIYKGRVTNVEAAIQAAFIDFGMDRNGFLHISDLMPTYFGRDGSDIQETVGRKLSRRDRPPIQKCLRRGDEIVVQIIKEGIGTKGPTLNTYLSIPGRILVMMPGMARMGVSRKIEDETERRRLRQILDSLKPPKDLGFIIRTAGIGKTKAEIQRDLQYLTRLWATLEKKRDSGPGPMELHTEGDLVTRTVRDVFTSDVDRVVVDNKEVVKRVKDVIKLSSPRTRNKVEFYEETVPLFHQWGIERELESIYSRYVPLPSGGSLVIDSTEAVVAIDVNSGRMREHADAETTAFRTDMEAADEIPRQLKLRDLGGVIICDFIDLRFERHRRELEERLHANFQRDRAKTKVLRMSQFGIIEITRQRMRPSLKRSIYFDCPHCKGAGLAKTPESMSLDVMRKLAVAISDAKVVRIELTVCPEVSYYLQNKKRTQIAELEATHNKRISIKADATVGLDEVRIDLFDVREGRVFLEVLGMMAAAAPPHVTQLGRRPQQGRQRGRRDNRDNRRDNRNQQQNRRPEPMESEEDDFEMDRVEDAVDEREEEQDITPEMMPEISPQAEQDAIGDVPLDDVASSETNELPSESPQPALPEQRREVGRDGGRDDRDGGRGGRQRGRRGGRGGRDRGRNDSNYERGLQGQEQSIGPKYVDEFDVSDEDLSGEAPESDHREESEPSEDTAEVNGNVLEPQQDDRRFDRPRGGGRGRGQRGGPRNQPRAQQPPIQRQELPTDQPVDEVSGSAPREESEFSADGVEGGKRRRRRRGGRGRRRRNGPSDQPMGDNASLGQFTQAPRQETESRVAEVPASPQPQALFLPPAPLPPPPAPRAAEATKLAPTGSTDKHLVHDDEPVAPQPISRPRTYRDLDHIPDDFD